MKRSGRIGVAVVLPSLTLLLVAATASAQSSTTATLPGQPCIVRMPPERGIQPSERLNMAARQIGPQTCNRGQTLLVETFDAEDVAAIAARWCDMRASVLATTDIAAPSGTLPPRRLVCVLR